ncbi:rhomboid family intramembrane serine protease [Marinicella sp. W31]|uniref:rhomboid family intramembrane serine protease n=1 Tax=Marinicella sp. W31 TaxID=3023713 RepID=UPI00375744E1
MSFARNNPLSSIPPVTLNVLIAIVVMFVFQQILPPYNPVIRYFVLFPIDSNYFYPWQLLTYGLLHADFMHLFFNGFAIWMFGSQIERQWGEKRYSIFIIACIIGSGILHALLSNAPVIGISGGVFGLLVAFGMMFPDARILLLFPPMPIKAKYFVMGYAAITLISSVTPSNSNIAHLAHLGGAITGFLLIQYWRKKPPFKFK